MNIFWDLADSNAAPITGAAASTSLKIWREVDGYCFDWYDFKFKSSGWTSPTTTFTEVDPTNLPGVYKKNVDISTWNEGGYAWITTYTGALGRRGLGGTYIRNGYEIDASIASEITAQAIKTKTDTMLDTKISSVPTLVWSAATRTLTSFGTLVNNIWQATVRSLTDKIGYKISGTIQTLDELNDLSTDEVIQCFWARTRINKEDGTYIIYGLDNQAIGSGTINIGDLEVERLPG
jgi:hypothetical protein